MGIPTWDDLAVIGPITVALLGSIGGAIAWLSGWGRRKGQAQREDLANQRDALASQAEANKVITDTAAELLKIRQAMGAPLVEELGRRAAVIADQGQRITTLEDNLRILLPLQAEVQTLRDQILDYQTQVIVLAAELDELRPLRAEVQELRAKLAATEGELAETNLALMAARAREAKLIQRLDQLEGEGDKGRGKRPGSPPGP